MLCDKCKPPQQLYHCHHPSKRSLNTDCPKWCAFCQIKRLISRFQSHVLQSKSTTNNAIFTTKAKETHALEFACNMTP